MARAGGVRTVLTPPPATDLPEELFRLCDFCVPNESEVELLTGRKVKNLADAESAARELRNRGVRTVVVTMGVQGALLFDGNGATHVPAVTVEAVDPTGAGDAFTAALAVSLAEGHLLQDAARRASVVAALTVTRIGTQAAFPLRAEVEEWLATPSPIRIALPLHRVNSRHRSDLILNGGANCAQSESSKRSRFAVFSTPGSSR